MASSPFRYLSPQTSVMGLACFNRENHEKQVDRSFHDGDALYGLARVALNCRYRALAVRDGLEERREGFSLCRHAGDDAERDFQTALGAHLHNDAHERENSNFTRRAA